MSGQLEQVYRTYLDALNGRRLDDLDQFVHDQVVYNDTSISRQQYAQMIAEDVQKIPDLYFNVDLLITVTTSSHAACGLTAHPNMSSLASPPPVGA